MVRKPRYLGIDDGPFTFDDARVTIAGVMTRGASIVEAVLVDEVTVDGWDATERVLDLVARLPGKGPDVVLLSGVTLGGMNLVDLGTCARATGSPVLGVSRRPPRASGLERPTQRAPDPERRRALVPHRPPVEVRMGERTLWVQAEDPDSGHIEDDMHIAGILGPAMGGAGVPEPLRLAHHIATAIVRGVSGTPP